MTGHDSNPNLPRHPGLSPDETMHRVLGYVIDNGGWCEDEPGELLKAIAAAMDCDYFAVAIAVRTLEEIGFISVVRHTSAGPYRGNRIQGIALVEGPNSEPIERVQRPPYQGDMQ